MTAERYQEMNVTLHVVAALVLRWEGELVEFIDRGAEAEAVGPFIDPTLYREKREDLAVDLRIARAFHRLQKELRVIIPAEGPVR